MERAEYRLLGALEVHRAGQTVNLGGPRQRAVLAALLLRANETVSVSHLCQAVWEFQPLAVESNVRTYVAGLRRRLRGPDEHESRLLTRLRGYVLLVGPNELDSIVFEELADRGRQAAAIGDFTAAAELFAQALRMWRGRPLEDLAPGPLLRGAVARLEEQHLAVLEQHAQARMELGQHRSMVCELRRLVADHPGREELWVQLMVALYRSGCQADALAAFTEARHRLVTELGIEPGARLRETQQQILAGDPAIEPARTATPVTVSAHRQLPMDVADFTGRQAELQRLHQQVDTATGQSVAISAVVGMAGVGKTALAVRAAHELTRRGRFDEIQLWADLHGFDRKLSPADPAEVLEGFLGLLGVPRRQIPSGIQDRAALYRDRLAGKRALVLLDNVLGEEQIRPLLPGSSSALVLVTSRRTLPGLDGARSVWLDGFTPDEAVALLAKIVGEDAVAAEPAEAARIAGLCGYLPIAVTLAARRLRARPAWALADLAARLDTDARRLDQLSAGTRAVRAAFDMSYLALPPEQRRVFRLLGLHPGDDFGVNSAAALVDAGPADADELLEGLLDEHLLWQTTPGRYRMHNLLRLYARDRAHHDEPAPDRDAAVYRLACYQHAARSTGPGLASTAAAPCDV